MSHVAGGSGRARAIIALTAVISLTLGVAPAAGNPVRRLSANAAGMEGNGASGVLNTPPDVTNDGSLVAYTSDATNLEVPPVLAGTMHGPRALRDPNVTPPGPGLVATDTNGAPDIFVYDAATGVTRRESVDSLGHEADGASRNASVSGNGRSIVFESDAHSLDVADTNNVSDIYLRDLISGKTTRVSVSSAGGPANGASSRPSISDDGSFVAFSSLATNLVARAPDTNDASDVFVRDIARGTTTLVSAVLGGGASDGPSSAAQISGDGRTVTFQSDARNFIIIPVDSNAVTDIFSWSRKSAQIVRVSALPGMEANGPSTEPSISSDGLTIAFTSRATNFDSTPDLNGASDIFLSDATNGLHRVTPQQTDRDSMVPSVSAHGGQVTYISAATNIVPEDTNATIDAFIYNPSTGVTARVSTDTTGQQANGKTGAAAISGDGRTIVFASEASNLAAGDTNGVRDVFMRSDETNCPDGGQETGPISGHIHGELEPAGGPTSGRIHSANCAFIVPAGL